MGCLPYFKFYPGDWLTDRKVRRLTPDARCLYWDLLALSWNEGGIPADLDELADEARVRGFTRGRFDKAWAQVEQFWVHGQNGHLVNPRQEHERGLAAAAHERRVEAGRSGGKAKPKQNGSNA